MAAGPGPFSILAPVVSSSVTALWRISQALFEGALQSRSFGGAGKALRPAAQASGDHFDLCLQGRAAQQRCGVERIAGRHAQAPFELRTGARGGRTGSHAAAAALI